MKTPQQLYPKLAKALGIEQVYLKREDQHPYGSHKGRSIPLMIKAYLKRDGINNFVISSSGNAALAAIKMAEKHNQNNPDKQITLRVFVGKKILQKKLELLQSKIRNPESQVHIEQVERPKQEAFQLDKSGESKFLRQSTDDLALEGYVDLANELYKIPNLAAVFIPTSSGTTAQAVAETFVEKKDVPQVHIVQTSNCHPIAEALGATAKKMDKSVAGAIVDNVAHRKQSVVNAIKNTNGTAWIPTEEEIIAAQTLVKDTTKINISTNSALSIAGLQKALSEGIVFEGPVVCVVTGH
jgi:threonine synthase